MTTAQTVAPPSRKPLRLWPGVTAAFLALLSMFVLPRIAPEAGMYAVLGGAVGGLIILLWWLFWSRAPWSERLIAFAMMVVTVLVTQRFLHESVSGAGMGMFFYIYAVPLLAVALVAWAFATRRLGPGPRRAGLVATAVIASVAFLAVRLDGISNTAGIDFEWRWTPTAEEKLLAEVEDERLAEIAPRAPEPAPLTADAAPPAAEANEDDDAPVTAATAETQTADLTLAGEAAVSVPPPPAPKPEPVWPGFRGPARDGVVHGVRIATDWSQSPPVELWRRPVGPGWSSFAVDGDRVYTQEQLGEDEVVTCYDLDTGEPVWRHRDATRFWEANAGAGPRGTPTLHAGRVYTFGATGILNALDARDGSVVWSQNAASDTKIEVPYWGFSSSPVVVGDLVVVATAGTLAAYDAATGVERWLGEEGKCCYSSPHVATIEGVEQVLLLNGAGAISVAPSDGTVLWKHEWPGDGIVQPALTDDGGVLIGTGSGMGGEVGLRRVSVAREAGEWTAERGVGAWSVEERWTSTGLKPYFNDFVVHEGHAYGFDGGILAAIELESGQRKWKGGRYGDGQLVLLADQDLLLVLSEKGELVLVDATPERFNERARSPAIEGKTWNHPALAGDVVLVRNSEEMAAFRLVLAGS